MTTIATLRREAATCTRCSLYARATQTVFGEGRRRGLMLVGEQPGDVEDRAGRPFVGPAGTLLRELLAEVGISAGDAYVTNAVKHFKWRPSGTRRIHDKPSWSEVEACGHWLDLEVAAVRPELVVCLGATAAQAFIGRTARVGALCGTLQELPQGIAALVTIHPSAVLRAGAARKERRDELRSDLARARKLLDGRKRQMVKSTKS
jgi:uracil-DNA glycosylase